MKHTCIAGLLVLVLQALPATAQVTQEWSQVVDGMGPYEGVYGYGTAASLAVDDAGNVYVATTKSRPVGEGSASLLVKYAPDGTLLWIKTHDGPAGTQLGAHDYYFDLALDDMQGVYVVGSETYEAPNGVLYAQILVQKYDGASGDLLWTRIYNSVDEQKTTFRNEEEATEVATDAQGNVYVAGTAYQQGTTYTSNDIILIKYDPAGGRQWVQVYEAEAAGVSRDQVVDLALDAAGNAFLVGSVDDGFNQNYIVHKYASDGSPKWFHVYDSPATGSADSDVPVAVALDAQGNVFVTGTISADCADTCRDYLTIKYSPAGTPLWTARFDNGHGSLRNDDYAQALAVDASGNVYVTGFSQQADASYDDYLTVKYSPTGTLLWTRRYNGPVNEHDNAYAIALDDQENIYVTGVTGTGAGTQDSEYGTIKYSPAGDSLWFVMKQPPTGGSHDYPTDNAVDADGNVYVTGYQQLFSSANLITVKYMPAGSTPVEPGMSLPASFALHPSYPNPFDATTTIPYDVITPAHVRLTVHDLLGRRVATLVDAQQSPGRYEAVFDAGRLPSGIYFYTIEMGAFRDAGKMVLIR